MIQFVTYFIFGFCVAWLNLFMWGLSSGPANAVPYFALIGALLLLAIAAPMALFLPRVAAIVALIAVLLIVPWPVMVLFMEHSFDGFAILGLGPVVSGIITVRHLWKTRGERWLVMRSTPRLVVRVPLALLPILVFVLSFNARLVVSLILEGPP